MPTYEFKDVNTGEVTEHFFTSWRSKDDFLAENPQYQQTMTQAPALVTAVSGSKSTRVPDGFKEVLSKVAEAHPTSTVGERHGKKSIKDVKTREIIKKHVNKIVKNT